MINQQPNMQLLKLAKKIEPLYEKYETLLLVVLVGSIVIDFGLSVTTFKISIVPILVLTVIYYLLGFSLNVEQDKASPFDMFLHRLVYMGSSVALIGILFTSLAYTGNTMMLFVGFFSIIAAIVLIVYRNSQNPEQVFFPNKLILRIFIIGAMTAAIYITK